MLYTLTGGACTNLPCNTPDVLNEMDGEWDGCKEGPVVVTAYCVLGSVRYTYRMMHTRMTMASNTNDAAT